MSQVSQYAYLHARVSVLSGQLLPHHLLRKLIEQPLEQSTTILEQAGITGLNLQQDLDPNALEQSIVSTLLEEAALLIRPLSGIARDLMTHWMRRFEIINIKRLVRDRIMGQTRDKSALELLELAPFRSLPVEDLIHTEDAGELLRLLEKTVYADMARLARAMYEEKRELFGLEAAFDRQYFTGLVKRVKSQQHNDQMHLRTMIGSMIDQLNLVWLLRYRFVYHLAPSHTYLLLVPSGQHLGSHQLLELVQQDSLPQVLEKLPDPLKQLLSDVATINAVEVTMEQELVKHANMLLKRSTFNLGRAFAYMLLREKQLLQIHVALKGKHLRLDNDLIFAASGWHESQANIING
jgi:V/A-type H+-transporting ATPase subunit C